MAWLARCLLAAGLLCLAGCGPEPPAAAFKAVDVTGADFGRGFQLVDQDGQRRRLEDFRGRTVVLFFGYTHCPDVCPTTLRVLALAQGLLGAEASGRVQVLFVTVDPERDTPERLKAYLAGFHPGFLGLRGTEDELQAVTREFRVSFQEHTAPDGSTHRMNHTSGSYVLDARGRLRLFIPAAQSPDDIAADLRRMVAEG